MAVCNQRFKRLKLRQRQRRPLMAILGVVLALLIGIVPNPWWLQAAIAARPTGSAADLKTPPTSPSPPPPQASPQPIPQATPQPVPTEAARRGAKPEFKTTRQPAPNPNDGVAAATYEARLAEADRLFQAGQRDEAMALYRQVKAPAGVEPPVAALPAAITEVAQLPAGAQVYWREADAGVSSNLYTAIRVPLELLVEQYPQFIPGHLRLASFLEAQKDPQAAQTVLDNALARYPNQPDLVRAVVDSQAKNQKWIESALLARQFAVLNPESPRAAEFSRIADQNMQKFQSQLRGKIRESAITGALTGLLGVAVTGSPFASMNTVQTMMMLARGEAAIGASAVRDAKRQIKFVEDPAVVNYVNRIGHKLAALAGRNEFQYEFFVILDDSLNAFALPGGKIFIHSGAITRSRSEAALAGLLGHEIAHAVLSHGFQLVTQGTAIANVTSLVPYVGGLATQGTITRYSRQMEREADVLGTRLLVKAGYAADGLLNLTTALNQQERLGGDPPPAWLSSHPPTPERMRYLEGLIRQNNYNRFAYEGVAEHQQVKTRIRDLMVANWQKQQDKRKS